MKTVKKQLTEVFSNPTAPYKEAWVLNYIKSELKRLKTPYFQDKWGNIIAGVSNKNALKNSSKTALIAHTDHPGFHILKQIGKNKFSAQWHGGYPPKTLGARLAIYHPENPGIKSIGVVAKEIKKGMFEIKVTKEKFKIKNCCFGAFDFPAYKFKQNIVETRVADDLTGVVIILSTLQRLNKKELKNYLGIFTTAEETGFKGTLGLLQDKTLGPKNKAVSLEASREMSEAIIGKGPVIRLGDRRSIFDNFISMKFDAAAAQLKKLKFQKRVMSGGTCEATAFNLFGIRCGGMAIPLGNYHNQKKNGKPGPEYVSLKDVESAVTLCVQFYKNESKGFDPAKKLSVHLMKEFKKSRKYFSEGFQK